MKIKGIIKFVLNYNSCDLRIDKLKMIINYKVNNSFFYKKTEIIIASHSFVYCNYFFYYLNENITKHWTYYDMLKCIKLFLSNKEEIIELAKKQVMEHVNALSQIEEEHKLENEISKCIKEKIKFEFEIKETLEVNK